MKYLKSKQYDNKFIKENMMGPNSMIILENLLEDVPLTSNMRVLDLGCGTGVLTAEMAKLCDYVFGDRQFFRYDFDRPTPLKNGNKGLYNWAVQFFEADLERFSASEQNSIL